MALLETTRRKFTRLDQVTTSKDTVQTRKRHDIPLTSSVSLLWKIAKYTNGALGGIHSFMQAHKRGVTTKKMHYISRWLSIENFFGRSINMNQSHSTLWEPSRLPSAFLDFAKILPKTPYLRYNKVINAHLLSPTHHTAQLGCAERFATLESSFWIIVTFLGANFQSWRAWQIKILLAWLKNWS